MYKKPVPIWMIPKPVRSLIERFSKPTKAPKTPKTKTLWWVETSNGHIAEVKQPPKLKNMLVKLELFPQVIRIRGENKNGLKPPTSGKPAKLWNVPTGKNLHGFLNSPAGRPTVPYVLGCVWCHCAMLPLQLTTSEISEKLILVWSPVGSVSETLEHFKS